MKEILVDLERCVGCKTCELSCAVERNSASGRLYRATKENPLPISRIMVQGQGRFSLPLQCRHCKEAPCLDACTSGAIERARENEDVILDTLKCVGCWMCMMVCPFGVITPSFEQKVAIKCDRCHGREEPACVAACPTKALVFCDPASAEAMTVEKKKNLIKKIFTFSEEGGIVKRKLLSLETRRGKEEEDGGD